MKIPFGDILGEDDGCKETHASFDIIGYELDPKNITSNTGIIPYKSHKKGEKYNSKSGRIMEKPWGLWIVTTEEFKSTSRTMQNANFLT